jgi:hypothetical protein
MDMSGRLRRSGWLGRLQGLLTVAVVLTGLAAAVRLWPMVRDPHVTARMSTGFHVVPGPEGLPPGVLIDTSGTIQVFVGRPTPGQVALSMLTWPTCRRSRTGGPARSGSAPSPRCARRCSASPGTCSRYARPAERGQLDAQCPLAMQRKPILDSRRPDGPRQSITG